jgi:hypothetical protein
MRENPRGNEVFLLPLSWPRAAKERDRAPVPRKTPMMDTLLSFASAAGSSSI